jgi:predicted nucleic acid-binding protein
MRLVLDSSAALAWVYPDETTNEVRHVFDTVGEDGAIVPAHWRLEVANGLTAAVRRGRFTAELRAAALADLDLLDILIDASTNTHAWGGTLNFAERFGLTLYDAAYLELAQRRALPLASLDRALLSAAQTLGIPRMGL